MTAKFEIHQCEWEVDFLQEVRCLVGYDRRGVLRAHRIRNLKDVTTMLDSFVAPVQPQEDEPGLCRFGEPMTMAERVGEGCYSSGVCATEHAVAAQMQEEELNIPYCGSYGRTGLAARTKNGNLMLIDDVLPARGQRTGMWARGREVVPAWFKGAASWRAAKGDLDMHQDVADLELIWPAEQKNVREWVGRLRQWRKINLEQRGRALGTKFNTALDRELAQQEKLFRKERPQSQDIPAASRGGKERNDGVS